MSLPFGRAEFLEVFARYNTEIWPLQIVAVALAGAAVATALTPRQSSVGDRLIVAILAAFWLVCGVAFHLRHFTSVTPAARIFGWGFVAGALALLVVAVEEKRIAFAGRRGPLGVVGTGLVAYALIGYPLVGAAVGHVYPAVPILGVTPCPTTLLTVGLLLWAPAAPSYAFIVPLAWSFVGLGAAVNLGMVEDLALVVSAIACVAAVATRTPQRHHAAAVTPSRGATPR